MPRRSILKRSVPRGPWGALVAAALAAALLAPAAPAAAQPGPGAAALCDTGSTEQFSDVAAGDYGAAYALCMRALGLSVGRGDGSYGPGLELSRAQMAAFLVRLWRDVLGRNCPSEPAHGFTDTAGNFAAADIACLYALGITKGTSATTYGPSEPLRASQISRFLYRLYLKTDGSCPQLGGDAEGELEAAVECLAALRILPNLDEGTASEPVTRAEMGVYVIGLWHNLSGRGLPPPPPSKPPAPADGTHAYTAVAAGANHSCALRTDATITCWGSNRRLQTNTPAGTYTAVAAGLNHSCALRTDATITCWGNNRRLQTNTPAGTYTAVAAGLNHSCALRTDATITCWGNNGNGKADAPRGTYNAVAAGTDHSCALRTDATITCWGLFRLVHTPADTYTAVAAGADYSCALRTDATITCWGDNKFGQADAPRGTYNAVAAGADHSCALRTNGTIICWGNNGNGQTDAPDGTYTAVAAGVIHSCALRPDGTITCWGDGPVDAPDGI